MIYAATLLVIIFGEWGFFTYWNLAYPEDSDTLWYVLRFSKHLGYALAIQASYSFSGNQRLRIRATFAFLACVAWCNVPVYLVWYLYGVESQAIAPGALLFLVWCVWVAARSYHVQSDEINHDNVMLLFLRPRGFIGLVKSFFGMPVESVCILSDGYVWSFRSSRGKFCRSKFTKKWLNSHIVVDTRVAASSSVNDKLLQLIDTQRGIGVKCVYVIRKVLSEMGAAYTPKTVLHYIPGVYVMQILRGRDGTSR